MSGTQQTGAPLDLEAIKKALADAPPYPWKVVGENYCLQGFPQVEYADEKGSYIKVHGPADAHLIANAPTWLADLVARVEELERWQDDALKVFDAPHGQVQIPRRMEGH